MLYANNNETTELQCKFTKKTKKTTCLVNRFASYISASSIVVGKLFAMLAISTFTVFCLGGEIPNMEK